MTLTLRTAIKNGCTKHFLIHDGASLNASNYVWSQKGSEVQVSTKTLAAFSVSLVVYHGKVVVDQ